MNCKVCKAAMITTWAGENCFDCDKYSVVIENGVVITETINVDNYFLTFMPRYREADISEMNEKYHIIRTLSMDELTHEDALKWIEKLKLYVSFQ